MDIMNVHCLYMIVLKKLYKKRNHTNTILIE
jgi:hypothetical protein